MKASQALSSEMVLPRLTERLMTIALQSAGADRGLLILPHQNDYRIEAEALADAEGVVLHSDALDDPAVPLTIIRYAIRTQEPVMLDDAAKANLFSEDPYLSLRQPRSVLCLPLVRQGVLGGLLYLENTPAPHVFTPERARLLEVLASQAAISLENSRPVYRSATPGGSAAAASGFRLDAEPDGTPDFVNQVWLEYSGQTPEFIQSHPEAWMAAVHPEDREMAAKSFWQGVHSGRGFAIETRSLRARDGTYRWHLQQAAVLRDAEGKVLKFVGTTTDIDDQKRAEETLRRTQADLAHVARVATLNAMTASIAHEVSQPLSGILTNASTSLRMLAADPPNLAGAAETARRTIRDANRAAEVIRRLRAMFSTKAPTMESVDLNDAAREVIALSAGELQGGRALVQTDFADDLPRVSADRVQLQQVILNLLLNAADAMAEVDGIRPRTILVANRPPRRRQTSSWPLVTPARAWIPKPSKNCSRPFTRPRPTAWASAYRSAVQSSRAMTDACGRGQQRARARRAASASQPPPRPHSAAQLRHGPTSAHHARGDIRRRRLMDSRLRESEHQP